ncbi:MAG: hypothetical protein HQ559_10730, partial [Lentisphaerae bacterium]|nr:hypothetical protein [Lentisphaerota bacterium]
GGEVSALKTAALAVGQTNPLTEVIEHVVNEIRGHVGACSQNTLGAGSTIPDKLLSAALAMIRFHLASRLPRFPFDETRKLAYVNAESLMRRVADCKFAIEEPEAEDTEDLTSPSPSIVEPSRTFARTDQNGI